MNGAMLRNREIRRLAVAGLLLLAAAVAASLYIVQAVWNVWHREQLLADTAAIGRLQQSDPKAAEQLLALYSKGYTDEELNRGKEAVAAYGYHDGILPSVYRETGGSPGLMYLGAASILLVFAAAAGAAVWLAFRRVYRTVREVSVGADHLMRGEFGIRFPDGDEGDLPILGHQFNQLSRRLQLTLRQLDLEKERLQQLISDVSHQVKTPLSSLLMFQELLNDPQMTAEDREAITERSKGELFRMERLIASMLTMSRLEAGVIELKPEAADVTDTLRRLATSLSSRLAQKRIVMNLDTGDRPIPFLHDPFWLSEAIGNLLANAIDFTPESGLIDVSVRRTEVSLSIVVKDHGTGIDPDDLPFIFHRFYQGKSARQSGRGGTGIGLALAALIVEKHGGRLHAESEPGRGAAFTMTFPLYGHPPSYETVS
jgi:signal transduction histidine kinase